jgi:hypothetical protein
MPATPKTHSAEAAEGATEHNKHANGSRFRNTEVLTFEHDQVAEIEGYFGWDLKGGAGVAQHVGRDRGVPAAALGESGSTGELLQELPRVLLAHRRKRRQGAVLFHPPPVVLVVAAAKQPPRGPTRRDLGHQPLGDGAEGDLARLLSIAEASSART